MQPSNFPSHDVPLRGWGNLNAPEIGAEASNNEQYSPCSSKTYCIGKRALDLLFAFIIFPVALPLCLILTLWIRCSSNGPVIYRHRRIGQNGRPFYLYKFRTMIIDSEHALIRYLEDSPCARLEWEQCHKLKADPRITSCGTYLRRLSLDELPQLWNVFRGEMSFVGPRPIVEEEAFRYGDALTTYLTAKPGITGLWQVSGRGTLSYEKRVILDVEYISTWSLLGDVKILLKTFHAIHSGLGAF